MNKAIYNQEIEDWDRNAKFYENENLMAYQEKIYRKTMYNFYNIKENERVLEAGGGVIKANDNTIIVDFSPQMIELCRKINKEDRAIVGSTHCLPFTDKSFDVVVANGLMHHLKVQEIFEDSLKEFLRVLKSGGRLCVFDRAYNLFPRMFFAVRKPLKKIYQPKSTCSTRNEVDFLESDVLRIEKTGFKIIRRKYMVNIFFQSLVIFANTLQYLFGHKTAYYWQKITWPLAYLIEKMLPFKVFCAEQVIVFKKK